MIVTLTANPSIDRTVSLPGALTRGAVIRACGDTAQPGGKGVNVARVLTDSGADAVAVLPVDDDDPMCAALSAAGMHFVPIPRGGATRTNLTLTEPDGTTTKINAPGSALPATASDRMLATLTARGRHADWVVLSGSLPAGMPDDWYADAVSALHAQGTRIALDTSDAPLAAVAARLPESAPDLVKPNSEELAQLVGTDPSRLEHAAAVGDLTPVLDAGGRLLDRGVGAALVTLGPAGALLLTADGAWWGSAPPAQALSTVGAGDSSLAGYLLADVAGHGAAERLRTAVAYGTAAVALPGTTLPDADAAARLHDRVRITALTTSRSTDRSAPSSAPPPHLGGTRHA